MAHSLLFTRKTKCFHAKTFHKVRRHETFPHLEVNTEAAVLPHHHLPAAAQPAVQLDLHSRTRTASVQERLHLEEGSDAGGAPLEPLERRVQQEQQGRPVQGQGVQ